MLRRSLAWQQQLFRFAVVGFAAAMVHWLVVIIMVQQYQLLPLVANIFGFLAAFQLSYWGHRRYTFSESKVLHRAALPKLLLLQIINFCINESLLYVFLSWALPVSIALFCVLAIMPLFTFIISKRFIFS